MILIQGGPEGVLVNQAAPAPVPLEPPPTLVHFEPGVHFHAQPDVHVHATQPEVQVQAPQPSLHLHPEQPDYLQPGVQVKIKLLKLICCKIKRYLL